MHGIGGRTIAEAKANMSMLEALQWMGYMRRRGSLNLGRRIEVGFAQIMIMMVRYMGDKKSTLEDFMPHERDEHDANPAEDRPAGMEQIAALLNSTAGPAGGGEE